MADPTSPEYAAARDAADPLSGLRDRFLGAETSLVYFDGNSLGRPAASRPPSDSAVRPRGLGRPADPRLGRGLARPAADRSATSSAGSPRRGPRPDRVRRLDDRAALQADAAARRRTTGSHRDRHRPRQLPDRPVRRGGHRGRPRPDPALDRASTPRPGRRRPGPRAVGPHRAGPAQPGRVPLRASRRRGRDHRDRPRRGRTHALGPVPLGRRGAASTSTRGGSTSRSAAATSTSTAGRARPPSCTWPTGTSGGPHPADPGLDGHGRTRSDGPGLPPTTASGAFLSGTPPIVGMLAIARHGRPDRGGGPRRGPRPSRWPSRRTRSSSPTRWLPSGPSSRRRATRPGAAATSPSTTPIRARHRSALGRAA